MRGKLKSWRDDKGYGFIATEELDKDVFIHISSLKNMPRKPKVGDHIQFEVELQDDGKNRAVNCHIEGLKAVRADERKRKPATKKRQGDKKVAEKSGVITKLWPVALLVMVLLTLDRFSSRYNDNEIYDTTSSSSTAGGSSYGSSKSSGSGSLSIAEVPNAKFSCDGRQYCSQMTSRAEAEFFIRNCPNTKMDGDNDGVPCESDSRF